MKARKAYTASQVEYAVALAAYRNEQERMRYQLDKTLRKYGKPKISLEELRRTLDTQLGDVSLSEMVIQMRKEGY